MLRYLTRTVYLRETVCVRTEAFQNFHVIRGPAWKWIPGIFTDTFMLSPTAPVFGNLASATSRALAGLPRSVSRVLEGDAAEKVLDSGDGGQHIYASRLGSEVKSKQAQINSLQNAVSFSQSQRGAFTVAMSAFNRMTDEEMAENLIRLSRDRIASDGNIALMTQARGINQNLMNTLL